MEQLRYLKDLERIEDVIEPYLIRQGLLERTPRGRVASHEAYTHISSL